MYQLNEAILHEDQKVVIKMESALENSVAGAYVRRDITDSEFKKFQSWIYDVAGISMSDHKKALVMGRLAPRMRYHHLHKYSDYFDLVTGDDHPEEVQIAIDLLTTNETYFFREKKHFEYLQDIILNDHGENKPLRVWSAASSSGEEAYSLAMILQDYFGDNQWEILASDLSSRVLEKAHIGHYKMERAQHIPEKYLKKYCLRGINDQAGTLLISDNLKRRIQFKQINLNAVLPETGDFDLIVLRNVMIYFDADTRRQVTERIVEKLKPGGHLFIGHSESLNGITDCVKPVKPAIYRKP